MMVVTRYHHMTDEELLRHAYLTRGGDELTMELAARLTKFMPRDAFTSLAGPMPPDLYTAMYQLQRS